MDDRGSAYLWQAEIARGVLTTVGAAVQREASDASLERSGRHFALKTILPLWIGHPLAEARVARERELSAELHAPPEGARRRSGVGCCIEILGAGRQPLDDGRSRPFHVSPLYAGTTVAGRLRAAAEAGRRLDAAEVLRWAGDALAGLGALHAIGWVHRDVKPQNIYLPDREGRQGREGPGAILIDYGLAVRARAPRRDGDEPFGTPAYVSPEVIAGAQLDGRADLYSFGLVLFEILCGRRAFTSRDPIALIESHLSVPPPALRALRPELSIELDRVIGATLRKAPGDRPASAEELARLLAAVPEARR